MTNVAENLARFINSDNFTHFTMMYYHHTGNKLETIEQFIDLVISGEFTIEDAFMEYLNHIKMTYEEECYWEDNMQKFDFSIYYPGDKDVKDGSWIKVRTVEGYEIHWAKKATRKRRYNEMMLKEINRAKVLDMTSEQLKAHGDKIKELQVQLKIGLQPYEVFYYRTKTRKTYVTTDQYEMADVDEVVGYIIDKAPCVKVKSLFTSINKEQIFYLRTRGIPKELALIMANMKHCYFSVNIKQALELYNKSTTVKIISNGN